MTFNTATSVSGALWVHLVSALSGWLSREFFSALQRPSLSASAGSASGQISRLLEGPSTCSTATAWLFKGSGWQNQRNIFPWT